MWSGTRVLAVRRADQGFLIETSAGSVACRAVVLATGGRSLPKTGSDGLGYEFARALGHSLVAQTPGLAPLVLDPSAAQSVHAGLSGIAIDGELSVWVDGAIGTRLAGALLFTHFGVSGPLVLNVSRHWARARLEGRAVRITLNFYPGDAFDAVDARWVASARDRPGAMLRSVLADHLPGAVTLALLDALQLQADQPLTTMTREDRRRLVHALVAWPLAVVDTRGYNYAEVTAGGVTLSEIDPGTMESRICPRLFFAGEILDVDGRIGGFNFQWAWSSARAAARGMRALGATPSA
jgi:predicted Rossmann fold flavoprotein